MIRSITCGSVLSIVMFGQPGDLSAQFNPFGYGPKQHGPSSDPRVRRAVREEAVAIIGPNARDFVETQGDEAVAAIFACSKPVAAKLAEFHMCGEMGKLPRPRDLLRVIAQPRHGDDVALWAIHHARELADPDSFDAYLSSPLEYAMGLKQLAAGAAEARAGRLNQAATATASLSPDEKLTIVVAVGFLLIVGVLLWRRKHASIR